jgi:O-antigen/teichoic acid export membrane protein
MKSIKNSIYGVSGSLATPLLMLFTIPIFLGNLGIESYAMWVLINSIIASLAIFNFGGSIVVTKFISLNRNDSNKDNAEEIFSTVFFFQSIVVIVIYLFFLIIAPIFAQFIISDNLLVFVDVLYIAIPIFFIKQSEMILHAFLNGYEQFGHVAILSIASKILFFSTQMLLVIATKSILDVFYGALIILVLSFWVQVFYIKRMCKYSLVFTRVNIKTAKSLLNFGSWNWLSSLASMLRMDSDKWIVSGLLGLKTFGFYSIGVLVFNQIYHVIGSSVYWIFSEVSKERLSKKTLVKKYWKLLFYVCIISLIVSFSLTNLSFLFKLWLGDKVFQDSKYYLDTFLLLLPVFTLNIASGIYIPGLGLVKYRFFADMASLIVKVITIWLVLNVFDIKQWLLFFIVFIAVEFIAYAIIISKNLPIKITHLIMFFLLQVGIVWIRV